MRTGTFFIIFLLVSFYCTAQDSIATINSPDNFKARHTTVAYFNKLDQTMHVDFEYEKKITRRLYNASYQLLKEYTIPKSGYFYSNHPDTLIFASEMITENGVFEIFRDRDDIVVYRIDFEKGNDEKVFELRLRQSEYDERMLAVLPGRKNLRIIGYSPKKDKLNLYTWYPNGDTNNISFDVPEHNMTPQEEKKFGKTIRVKFKKEFKYFPVNRTDEEYPINIPGDRIFYNDEKIYVGIAMPFYMGVYLMELDEQKKEIKHRNFFINAGLSGLQADYYKAKRPFFTIYDSLLIVNNSSSYQFECLFYSLNTWQQVKKYSASVKDSINKLVHSELVQKGTYGSRNQEKILENEKRFMLRMIDGTQFLTLSVISKDSLTVTFGSFNETAGIGGTLLAIGTGVISSLAFLNVTSSHYIFYITSTRNKFIYSHSRFSTVGLEPSKNDHVNTLTDKLLDDLDVKEIGSASSFIIHYNNQYHVGVLNKVSNHFTIYRYIN